MARGFGARRHFSLCFCQVMLDYSTRVNGRNCPVSVSGVDYCVVVCWYWVVGCSVVVVRRFVSVRPREGPERLLVRRSRVYFRSFYSFWFIGDCIRFGLALSWWFTV